VWCILYGVLVLCGSYGLSLSYAIRRFPVSCLGYVNLLKPAGYVICTISSTTVRSAHTVFVLRIYLRTDSDLCHLHHKIIGFYNRDEKCLLRGTDWVFK
jgi:hypothetical protein